MIIRAAILRYDIERVSAYKRAPAGALAIWGERVPSVAVFVDAGYLFAQGSTALSGSKKPRSSLRLHESAVVSELSALARQKAHNAPLLRVYWYDGSRGSNLPLDHATLAHTDYVKLRLGLMNSRGQQKGVDSLIVTDLIELARNHAISDALLLSGDEDVRIGVVIAQSFGVRVHLLGITPCRGSQSPQLMQEADTTSEWDGATIGKFLSVTPLAQVGVSLTPPTNDNVNKVLPNGELPLTGGSALSGAPDPDTNANLDMVAVALHSSLNSSDVLAIQTFWSSQRGLPQEFDGRLIAQCRTRLGRSLDQLEKRYVRGKFTALIKADIDARP